MEVGLKGEGEMGAENEEMEDAEEEAAIASLLLSISLALLPLRLMYNTKYLYIQYIYVCTTKDYPSLVVYKIPEIPLLTFARKYLSLSLSLIVITLP